MTSADNNLKPNVDDLLLAIADYVCNTKVDSELAWRTARLAFLDSIGCAMAAYQFDACRAVLGPYGDSAPQKGVRVFASGQTLDAPKAAFDMTAMIRWLDFNDTWLAAEWGHPSDNFGGLLAAAQFGGDYALRDIFEAAIKAYEIQGVIALTNSFNQVGLDHVILVKLATAALSMQLMGGTKDQIIDVMTQVFVDGQSLRTYRHAPNTGPRKSWAAADASMRALHLCWLTQRGQVGYPSCLSANQWGFCDVSFGGKPLELSRPLESYVMENVLFKVAYPAEFHAQTAVEAAIALHPLIKNRLADIESIQIDTQEAAVRIISKTGPLHNPADRDHCLQYMVAIGLIHGDLRAEHYEDEVANDPRIDQLREKMIVEEDTAYTKAYFDSDLRAIPNRLRIQFKNAEWTEPLEVFFPLGHERRREEALPKLRQKLVDNTQAFLNPEQCEKLYGFFDQPERLDGVGVGEFLSGF